MTENSIANRETELQRLLADERSRCDQYKQIYETLKEQHKRLQDELSVIHQQLKEAVQLNEIGKNSKDNYVKKLEETLKEKQSEINKLKQQVALYMSDEVKLQHLKETNEQYKIEMIKLKELLSKEQEASHQLYLDNTVIKCELQFMERQNSSGLELLKANHIQQVNELMARISELQSSKPASSRDFNKELQEKDQEITTLLSKLKIANSEIRELTEVKESLDCEKDSLTHMQSTQLDVYKRHIKTLEDQVKTFSEKNIVLVKELQDCESQKKDFAKQLDATKAELVSFQDILNQCKADCSRIVASTKYEVFKLKTEHENEKQSFEHDAICLKQKLEQLVEENERLILQKSMIQQQQFEGLKESASQTNKELQEELRKAVEELEISKKSGVRNLELKFEKMKKELEETAELNNILQKEIIDLKLKLENQRLNDCKKCNVTLDQGELDALKKQFLHFQRNLQPTFSEEKESLYKNESHWELKMQQQKFEYEQRILSLETILKEHKERWENEKKAIIMKQKQYSRLISKLREKLNLQKLRLEEIELQNDLLKNNIPLEEHMVLKNKFSELKRKQTEFYQILLTSVPLEPELHAGNKHIPVTFSSLIKERQHSTFPVQISDCSRKSSTSSVNTSRPLFHKKKLKKNSHKMQKKLPLKISQSKKDKSNTDNENL